MRRGGDVTGFHALIPEHGDLHPRHCLRNGGDGRPRESELLRDAALVLTVTAVSSPIRLAAACGLRTFEEFAFIFDRRRGCLVSGSDCATTSVRRF